MPTPADMMVGRRLGAYLIESHLASGAMGDVFRGVHEALGRPVAIKTMNAAVSRDESLMARFFAEARAVNLIRHENIVECTDMVNDPGGTSYIVMELLEGQTLGAAIRAAGRLPPERAVRIADQIASALAAAHAKEVIHRDIKPENIFLVARESTEDYVKVLDFGIARLRPELGVQATQAGALIGTPAYMSPEQSNGDPIGPGTDIYSLGVVLFHMLTGRLPFNAATAFQMIIAHASEEPPRVDALANISTALADVVAASLRKLPRDRPSSMAALRAALRNAAGITTAARPTTVQDPAPAAKASQITIRDAHTDHDPSPAWTSDATLHPSSGELGAATERASDAAGLGAGNTAGSGAANPAARHAADTAGHSATDTGADQARPMSAADTVPPQRRRQRLSLVLGAAAVFVGSALAGFLVLRGGSSSSAARSVPVAVNEDAGVIPAAPDPLRTALDHRLGELHEEPPVPDACKTRDQAELRLLVEAAAALADGAPGSARAADLQTVQRLGAPAPADHWPAERWALLARARLYAGEPAEAVVDAARAALAACERYPAAHLLAGTALFRADRPTEAAIEYRRALDLAPDYAAAEFNLGLVVLSGGRPIDAIVFFDRVLAREPAYRDALIARGQAYLMHGEEKKALADLERAVGLQPESGDAYLLLGLAYERSGDEVAAQRAYCRGKALGNARAAESCSGD